MNTFKILALRFLRAFVAGAVSSAVVIPLVGITTYNDLQSTLYTLSLALVVGGIGGLLQAIDKYFRIEPEV